MMKSRRKQATDLPKLKNWQRLFFRFLFVEAEALGVEADAEVEAVEK